MSTDDDRGRSVADFAFHYERLRAVIDSVERSWTHPVEIVAVTKGFGPDAIEHAVAGGAASIGENYAQELVSKREVLERLRPQVQFIGNLQTNKVRQLVGPRRCLGEPGPAVDHRRGRQACAGRGGADPGELDG